MKIKRGIFNFLSYAARYFERHNKIKLMLLFLNISEKFIVESDLDLDVRTLKSIEYLKISYLKHKKTEKAMPLYNRRLIPRHWEMGRRVIFQKKIKCPKYMYYYYETLWKGEDLTDKTLFVFDYYSGFGDFIMFARYIPIIRQRVKRLILEANKNLYDFFKLNFPDCEIIMKQDSQFTCYDYTYHYELFLNLQKDFEHFPFSEGYLIADENLINKYSDILFNTNKLKVGIFWETDSGFNNKRTINLKEFIPILKNKKCQFYSIGISEKNSETRAIMEEYDVIDCAKYIRSLNDTAAIIKNLDLVISIDSLPVHLGGALGVKTFLILMNWADWRWFTDNKTTPWYYSVSIFRQQRKEKWGDVMLRIEKEINILTD